MANGTSRVRWAAAAILIGVFGSGVAVGVAVDRALPTPEAATPERSDERRDERRGLIVERVGLTAEQQVQVDSVVRIHRARMDSAAQQYRSVYWALVENTREQLKSLLTEEQAMTYDSLLAENDRRRRERREADQRERDQGQDGEGQDGEGQDGDGERGG